MTRNKKEIRNSHVNVAWVFMVGVRDHKESQFIEILE
jgi:uncharacterized protein with HEPN domain